VSRLLLLLLLIPILAGCAGPRVEVVRVSLPATLVEPIPVPRLQGNTNEAFESLLSEYDSMLSRCNDRMEILREVYP
jgi:hypothetical protein